MRKEFGNSRAVSSGTVEALTSWISVVATGGSVLGRLAAPLFVGDCGLWHRHPLEARKPATQQHHLVNTLVGACRLEVSRFPTHHPLFQLNTHLAGAHGAYDKVRCRGASEPADHPGRTRGARQSALLLCFWVSGFKSQPKRGPPKKGKLGFCLRSDKRLVFLPRGGQAFRPTRGGGGLRTEKGIRQILVQYLLAR